MTTKARYKFLDNEETPLTESKLTPDSSLRSSGSGSRYVSAPGKMSPSSSSKKNYVNIPGQTSPTSSASGDSYVNVPGKMLQTLSASGKSDDNVSGQILPIPASGKSYTKVTGQIPSLIRRNDENKENDRKYKRNKVSVHYTE